MTLEKTQFIMNMKLNLLISATVIYGRQHMHEIAVLDLFTVFKIIDDIEFYLFDFCLRLMNFTILKMLFFCR